MNIFRNFIVSLLLISELSGCVTIRDISHDSGFPTDYVVGKIYQLKQPVFVEKADLTIFGTYSGFILNRVNYSTSPKDVEEYERNRRAWPEIAGVAYAGTPIKIIRIELDHNPENGDMVCIQGNLIGLKWAKKSAELAFISKKQPYHGLLGNLPMIDPEILELVPNN